MRDPNTKTPYVFDYLWLYWVMRHHFPKDIVALIIGTTQDLKFGVIYYPYQFFLLPFRIKIYPDDVEKYYIWLQTSK
jgi:hypothetical protein